MWDHFSDLGSYFATCNICKVKLSFKSSVTNLKKHYDRKHPTIQFVNQTGNEIQRTTIIPSEPELSPPIPSTSSGRNDMVNLDASAVNLVLVPSAPIPPSVPQIVPQRRTYGNNRITSYISNRKTNNKEINEKIMKLFTSDFQPFRIVEDRGFRELMNYAFPNYVIPTRKYFANNMLPALYEKTKAELKERVSKEAKSICITVDIWTSASNDSFMALTGHYIEDQECVLRSILLDCTPLQESHTARNLADVIKNVCDDWNIGRNILLGVSDNGMNIKNAIERELGWKHFSCYSHTLNLVVQDALKFSESLQEILTKVKNTVRHFKQSCLAWNKLKKYQEQSGSNPRRLIQEVSTRWNSTYYMVKRCIDIKEALNSAMINLSMESFTSYEWSMLEDVSIVLEPCEEVTRAISGEKYVNGSLIIPITQGLIIALGSLDTEHVFLPQVDSIRQDLLGGLKRRFLNLDRSKTFTTAMILDPRFKLYFDDQGVADDTKRRLIALVTQEISATMPAIQSQSVAVAVQPQSVPKSIWKDFESKMTNFRPEGTAHSRAIIEVQRYMDESIISRTDCPLQWWKAHKAVYPHLYKVAVQKLNAMASSVPCERVFSAAGNIMTERRTRLGCRKLQQLLFLQQNT